MKECEEYDFTTSTEMSEVEEESEKLNKRKPKKKTYNDFVMDETDGSVKDIQSEATKKKDTFPEPPAPPSRTIVEGITVPARKPVAESTSVDPARKINKKQSRTNISSNGPELYEDQDRCSRYSDDEQGYGTSKSRSRSRSSSPDLIPPVKPQSFKRLNYVTEGKQTPRERSFTVGHRSRSPIRRNWISDGERSVSRSPLRSCTRSPTSYGAETERSRHSRPHQSYRRQNDSMQSRERSSAEGHRYRSTIRDYRYSERERSQSPLMLSRKSGRHGTEGCQSRPGSRNVREVSRSPFSRSHEGSTPRDFRQDLGSSTQKRNELVYPMPEERFQRRVIYLLTEIRDLMKKDQGTRMSQGANFEINPAKTIEEFQDLDAKFENEDEYAKCKSVLSKIGGSDPTDHMKKAMQRCMTNSVMAKMNMKGKKNKFAFTNTNLYKIIRDTVLACHQSATENKVNEDMSKCLKYAPERAGGGGRS